MPIRLDKKEAIFRNELIFAADAKAVNLDSTLTNLFMLLRHNGQRVTVRVRQEHSFKTLIDYMKILEQDGNMEGLSDHSEAAEDWLRCNLVNVVFRGNVVKEKISSLRPVHLESYRIRNTAQTRDYNSADQIWLMLRKKLEIMGSLRDYLGKGWDNATNTLASNQQLDVDSVGIIQMIKSLTVFYSSSHLIRKVRPLLEHQADLFCNDILRLLIYKNSVPRNVFIEYLRTLIGFHLSLYTFKVIHLLPKMVEAGTRDISDDFSIVVDVTDNLESKVARYACADMENTLNGLYNYFKATFEINSVQKRYEFATQNLDTVDELLSCLKNRPPNFDAFYENKVIEILSHLKDEEEEEKRHLLEALKFQDTYFDKYIQILLKAKGGYQYRYHHHFLDAITMKNTEYGFMADGRSRKHPRRGVIGSRLLETLVQLLVLEPKEGGGFRSQAMSVDDLINKLRSRYGIIINGLNEPRFANADVETHQAFMQNVNALKNKLRQIGFFTDLSDAYLLQKIRPRYKFQG